MGEPNVITVQITGYSLREVATKMADFINGIKGINLLVRQPAPEGIMEQLSDTAPQPEAENDADKDAD